MAAYWTDGTQQQQVLEHESDGNPDAADFKAPDFAPDPWYRNRVLLALWALMVALLLTLIIYGIVELSRGGGSSIPAPHTSTNTPTQSSTSSPSPTTTPSTTPSTTTPSTTSEAPPPETPEQTPEQTPEEAPPPVNSPAPTQPPRHHHHFHLPHLF
jgi:cytoskeletal protein RodZ